MFRGLGATASVTDTGAYKNIPTRLACATHSNDTVDGFSQIDCFDFGCFNCAEIQVVNGRGARRYLNLCENR